MNAAPFLISIAAIPSIESDADQKKKNKKNCIGALAFRFICHLL